MLLSGVLVQSKGYAFLFLDFVSLLIFSTCSCQIIGKESKEYVMIIEP
jgi:hypothetical protein